MTNYTWDANNYAERRLLIQDGNQQDGKKHDKCTRSSDLKEESQRTAENTIVPHSITVRYQAHNVGGDLTSVH